jgi:hypothetical protein
LRRTKPECWLQWRFANDIALVANASGGLTNIDSFTVTGSGISATACN